MDRGTGPAILRLGPRASRILSSIAQDGSLTVTINAMDYGVFGVVMETYPAEFEYEEDSSTIGVEHNEMDRTLTFRAVGGDNFQLQGDD